MVVASPGAAVAPAAQKAVAVAGRCRGGSAIRRTIRHCQREVGSRVLLAPQHRTAPREHAAAGHAKQPARPERIRLGWLTLPDNCGDPARQPPHLLLSMPRSMGRVLTGGLGQRRGRSRASLWPSTL